jgi:hypothetical protein
LGGEGVLVPRDINPSPPEEESSLLNMAIDYVKSSII